MIKSLIKEIVIMILLCIAIVLILGILFYNYIPSNKVVPTKEAYRTPNNVKAEIEEQITELNKIEISYEITDANLEIYKKSSSYKPGKSNPFALANTTGGNNTAGNTNNNGGDDGQTENQDKNTDVSNNSTGTFFNDTK